MSKASKAAWLSALVFPGCGHIYLKRYLKGALLAGTAIVCLYVVASSTMEVAEAVSVKIQRNEIPLDVAAITNAISTQSAGHSTQNINTSTAVFLLCWLIGIVDSYRLGRSLRPD